MQSPVRFAQTTAMDDGRASIARIALGKHVPRAGERHQRHEGVGDVTQFEIVC